MFNYLPMREKLKIYNYKLQLTETTVALIAQEQL